MRSIYVLTLILYFNSALWSQANSPQKRPFSVFYGKKFLQENNFRNQLNSLDHPEFKGPLNMAGFDVGIKRFYGVGNSPTLYWLIGFEFILPASIQVNDSITAKISGIQGRTLLFGKSFKHKKNKTGLRISFGFNTGRVNLKKNDVLRVKNDYFSPKLNISPWILLKRIRLGFACEYEYDLSKKDWKVPRNKGINLAGLDKFSQTGLSLYFSIGINIP